MNPNVSFEVDRIFRIDHIFGKAIPATPWLKTYFLTSIVEPFMDFFVVPAQVVVFIYARCQYICQWFVVTSLIN